MQTTENVVDHSPANKANIGYIGEVPVRNLWLLLLYASDLFRHQSETEQGIEDNPDDVADLVAEILIHHVALQIRRNLSLGYRSRNNDLRRIRGRIDLLRTKRRHLLKRGMVACRYEELSIDTPRNRYVAAALHQLSKLVSAQSRWRHQCHLLAMTFEKMGVSQKKPVWSEVAADRVGRHNANDRYMLDAARLAFELALPTEAAGNRHHISPDRSEAWVRTLFEKAIAGFYNVTLSRRGWKIRTGTPLHWPIEAESKSSEKIDRIFPGMFTDIILEDQHRRIIIDTKFTHILRENQWGKETLKSGYLYQIYAYLRSQERDDDPPSRTASGLLLHPSTGFDVNEFAIIQGHQIHFSTIDLTAETSVIRNQLFRAIGIESPEVRPH